MAPKVAEILAKAKARAKAAAALGRGTSGKAIQCLSSTEELRPAFDRSFCNR